VYQHLQDIQANVLLVAPDAEVELLKVYLPLVLRQYP
jgi:hypothetical protein